MSRIVKTRSGDIFSVTDLSGGLNIDTSKYEIDDNEAIGLINFDFTESGILTSRRGYRRYTPTAISGLTGVYGLYRYYKKNESTKYFIATGATGIYSISTAGVETALTINETLTTNYRFSFAVLNDILYMTNGINKPLAWSGTGNVRQMGIVAPSAGSSALDSGGTCTDGVHQIRITYYNSTDSIESSHYTVTSRTCGSGNNKINLSSLAASSDSQVDYIRIYMTAAGGSTFYYVTQQSDSTATYVINASDATIQANAAYGATNYLPPPTTAKFIEVASRRIYLTKNSTYKSRLYWSEIDTPEYFPANNYRDINPDDGDVISGLIHWNDMLYVFKENGTYCLTDPADPSNSDLREISKDIGCISPYSIASGFFQRPISKNDWMLVPGIILHTRFGVMGFDGSTFHPLSERVQPILDNLYEVNKSEMVGFFNKHKYYLAYTPKEGTAVSGGVVTFNQLTTDSGSEHKSATYQTDHDPASYSATYDARIDLSNTSTTNDNLTVTVYIDWVTYLSIGGDEVACKQEVQYEIFFSYDSGVSWKSKGVFKYLIGDQMPLLKRSELVYYYNHVFNDSSVTNVRLDYFYAYNYTYKPAGLASKVNLEKVSYKYDYTETITGSDVVNNQVLYYDSLHNAWSDWRNIRANCFCAWNGSGDKGEEFFGSSKEGLVYLLNTGYDDDGQDIFSLFQSKYYDVSNRIQQKRFNAITFTSDVFSDILHIEIMVDRVQRDYWNITLLPTYDSQIYWNDKYHGDVISDNVVNMIQKTLKMSSNSAGRYISIKFWKSSKSELQVKDFGIKYFEREGIR